MATTSDLAHLLDLEPLSQLTFRGLQPETDRQRVFGGQVAAQALVAGTRTIDSDFAVHSLHAYFLRPGDTSAALEYEVEVLRDGRSFGTRRVLARQHGRPIFFMTANFQLAEDGFEHQDPMPEVSPPERGLDFMELLRARGGAAGRDLAREFSSLEIRYLGNSAIGLPEDPRHPARAQLWVRVRGELPADPAVHTAAFTYASDLTLLGAALVPHGVTLGSPGLQAASLDHAIWFHRPLRADHWWLYDQWSPSASGARGLALARVFGDDGALAATVAQEGLIRMRPQG